ncbi:beta-N-acetylhexosaminidase [Parasphingorhabdus marina DSM 22363]|uniref:beta-N-acetylhexosaminidase n=1 Tax=Parasphingorhabdus marina DSM 22363 TaxID=1123272 RepID=A0A1N6GVT1_9SPHN|nr:beta-N-acetylhexosaminidase [Parasphingorhabdus marina]SIO11653.1 beta-N-acetylhexosaminidase [Parasphingorhabdus marina DSM 22363]
MKPVIFGMSGLRLTDDEKAFFRDSDPAGYIVFGRNVENKDQLRALTDELRDLHGRDDLAILIDQEGGRVARMTEPVWPRFPAGGRFGELYEKAPATAIEAARLNAQAIAESLREVGITVNCLPLLDVRQPETVEAIGDRAMGSDPGQVAALGRAVIDGQQRGGVVSVIKHMPGHGRAVVDSHLELPRVSASQEELELDIAPFRALSGAVMGMTAHIVYDAWDAEHCASLSPTVITDIIRGEIGFDGLLFSDDLDMKALKGDVPTRARDVVAAGCDIALNCWGRMDEMVAIADILGEIGLQARRRLDDAMASLESEGHEAELAELLSRRDALMAAA